MAAAGEKGDETKIETVAAAAVTATEEGTAGAAAAAGAGAETEVRGQDTMTDRGAGAEPGTVVVTGKVRRESTVNMGSVT
jgi:hypothetical protein